MTTSSIQEFSHTVFAPDGMNMAYLLEYLCLAFRYLQHIRSFLKLVCTILFIKKP
ncbi:MAG: hypothetical protein JETT_1416 [Candidatus Jettenia ecosi]|uniref:Uncharacterized protein n=1 Tax=Candidatus Jettenia ecosi TaxID=2494326 RepID=A0A533QHZ4_9BACT|nr:MAG: hypothetical protein JETT_1416 [Candidatus Jettenia ecosi]